MTWFFCALIAAVLYSAAAILAKMGIKKASPILGAGLCLLTMFISVFLMNGPSIEKLNIFRFGAVNAIFLIVSGALTGAAVLCLYKALHEIDTVTTVAFAQLDALLILWFGVLWWDHKAGTNLIVASVLCVAGIILTASVNSKKIKICVFAFLGAILLTAASVVETIGLSALSEADLRLGKLLIATIMIWIITVFAGNGKSLRQISFLDGIYSCLAGLAMVVGYSFINRANGLGNNNNVLQVYSLNLIFIIILASFFLKEKMTGKRLAGAIVFVAGLEILLLSKPLF